MKKILFPLFLFSTLSHAALFSLSGHHRFASNWFYNLDTKSGKNNGASDSSSFLEQRFIIRPDIIVDERFSVRTEFSLMNQNDFDSVVSPIQQTSSGAKFDATQGNDPTKQELKVRYAYLKWNSDMGIFRAGRMPKAWGLGLLYDDGANAEDDASTIVDRVGFEGQLGSLVLNFGFEKYEEGSLNQDIDDDEVFEASVKYESESSGVSIGLLFGRHFRGADSASRKSGYASSNEISFFAKKEWEDLSLGIEAASVSYDSQDDVYGALAKLNYTPGNWDIQLDGLYSSESGNRAFIVHPNYRPFLILFKQNLGANVGIATTTRYGRSVGYDPANSTASENGAMLGKLGLHYSFSQKKYKIGVVGGYALLSNSSAIGGKKDLGIEADFNFEQQWYDNFKTALTAGILLPGKAFGTTEKVYGMQIRSYLNF